MPSPHVTLQLCAEQEVATPPAPPPQLRGRVSPGRRRWCGAEEGGGAALVAFVGGDPAVRAADLGEAELVAEVVGHLGSTLGSWAHMYTGAGDHCPLIVRLPSTVQRPP